MKKETRRLLENVFLAVFAVLFLIAFYVFRSEREVLKVMSFGVSFLYVLWGIIHSAIEDRLTYLILLEYALFGVLVYLLLYSVLSY